jgi:Ca-activated chloride channel homolog
MVHHVNWANLVGLFWLIPLAGIIIALYLLRMRRKDMRVPASFLWPSLTAEVRANALFQKLKFSWLLVLQLLALLLIVLAFARPQFLQRGLGGKVTVIVLDVSASMSATDVRPSRLAAAIEAANDLVNAAQPGDRVSLIEAGPTPRVLFSMSSDVPKMRRSLLAIQPTDAEADVGEALRLAGSITKKEQQARIVLISDGVFPEIENYPSGSADLAFLKVGNSSRNFAISGFGVSDEGGQRLAFAGIKNYGLDAGSGTINLYADGKLFSSWKWTAGSGQTTGRTVPAPATGKFFEAKLEANDFLAADNYAVALPQAGDKIRTLLVSSGNFFLERVLSLDPRVELEKTTSAPAQGSWDLIVYDGVPEGPATAPAILSFGVAGTGSPVAGSETASNVTVTGQEDVPLLKGVNLRSVFIDRAIKTQPRAAGEVFAEFRAGTADYPLVVGSRSGGSRRLFVAFSPLKSDFPLQVGFPILVANAIDWLLPPSARTKDFQIATGRTFSLPAVGITDLKVVSPDGNQRNLKPVNGIFVVRDLRQVGTYKVGDRTVRATLRSDVESKVAPSDNLRLGSQSVGTRNNLARLEDFWRWLIAIALLVLVAEWWVFMRRS